MSNQYALQQLAGGNSSALEDFAELMLQVARGRKDAQFVQRGYKNNPAVVGGVSPYLHGGGGLLSPLGQSRGVLSAILEVGESALSYFPVVEEVQDFNVTVNDTPYLTFLTGVTQGALESWDNQPSAACDPAPVGGLTKACTITFPYGRVFAALRQVNALEVNRRVNRGEFTDLTLMNTPNAGKDPFRPTGTQPNANIIQTELNNRFYEMGVSMNRLLAPLAYSGTPAQNKGVDGSRQWIGLDKIINTNVWVDAFTANTCTALNSIVYNFQSTLLTDADPEGLYLYDVVQSMYRNFRTNAARMGLNPATWVIMMTDDLFYELTRVINIQEYIRMVNQLTAINTANTDGAQLHLSGVDQRQFNDDMYNNKYIPIDGQKVRVVTDYAIGATLGAGGSYTSDIYIVNEQAAGRQMTYWDFNRFSGQSYQQLFDRVFGGNVYSTDNGRFLWARNFVNFCGELTAVCEPRLLHHTPMLSGRILNVKYNPVIATRSPFPSDGNFYNGGRTNSSLPKIYDGDNRTVPTYPGINLQ